MANDLNEATVKLIADTVRDALRNGGPTPVAGSFRLPEDERLRAMIKEIVERELAGFEKTMRDTVQDLINETCRRLGLRIDDDHIVETSDQIRGLLKLQKSIGRLVLGLTITLLTGMFFGLLKLLGLNLENFGGKP